ncbi:uncharacterized protein LOC100905810 [Galendromus occidentalis]|uniref:Uncharacterized protein LOC100905810 n=1 Tax=Galendromus occidentalis TaxID=34638 RepID=A0AAJ6VW08_9ACAR|nr:uncharacterized protein LOC100905810 [Galendromus occidentalis]
MTCRQGDSGLDAAKIRSIWEDGYSPSKSYSSLSTSRISFANSNQSQRTHSSIPIPAAGNDRRSLSTFGPVGSPMRKKSLGAYDCSSGSFLSNLSSLGCGMESGFSPKRSPSLWDYSSGYSSGQASSLFSTGSCSDNSLDLSPPTRSDSMSLYDSFDHLHNSEMVNEKEQLNLIAKAISSLLMTRGNSVHDRVDTIKELFSLTSDGCRRASVACSGGHFLERERHVNAMANQRSHFRNEFNSSTQSSSFSPALAAVNGTYNNYSNSQPTGNDLVLERIEREAKLRRTSACQSETTFSWKGTLTTRFHPSPTFAPKVFVGGLPYDVTPDALTEIFGKFGLVTVQFPPRGRGHAYLVFDSEQQVQALLNACENKGPGQYFYWVSSRRGKDRHAQVIPWAIEDSDWIMSTESSCDSSLSTGSNTESTDSLSDTDSGKFENATKNSAPKKTQPQSNAYKKNTVFVGALHGEITAEGLQQILSDLFGPVAHVAIDCDKQRYPNGSGRATFVSRDSFRQAVLAEFVQVMTPRFSKIIQLDAYIEDGICTECKTATPIFCRHPSCFCYYCPMCFEKHRREMPEYHPPVMRNRNNGFTGMHSTSNHNVNRPNRAKTL